MTISKLTIFNLALTALGQDTIASVDEDTSNAKKLRLVYDSVVEGEFRYHSWKFCSKDITLSLASENIDGWGYTYNKPDGAVFVKTVFNDGYPKNAPKKAEFTEMVNSDLTSKVICCNLENAKAHVSYSIDNPTFWDSLFINVIAYALAKEIAYAVTGGKGDVQLMNSLYENALQRAISSDMLEENIIPHYSSDFLEVRNV